MSRLHVRILDEVLNGTKGRAATERLFAKLSTAAHYDGARKRDSSRLWRLSHSSEPTTAVHISWVPCVSPSCTLLYPSPYRPALQAQTWFNEHLCRAIERCPRKAVVVLDNVHVLEGEEIRLLDKMLSLTDGEK